MPVLHVDQIHRSFTAPVDLPRYPLFQSVSPNFSANLLQKNRDPEIGDPELDSGRGLG